MLVTTCYTIALIYHQLEPPRQITRRNAVEKGEGNSVTESEQEGVLREAGHSNLPDARRNFGRIDGLGPNLNRQVLHCFRDRSLPLQLALDFLQECPRMFVLRSDCVSNSRGSAFSGQVARMAYARGYNGGGSRVYALEPTSGEGN